MDIQHKYLYFLILLLAIGSVNAIAQPREIKGTVYRDGEPAAGVTVKAHKSSASYFTSFDGKYELRADMKSKWIKFIFSDKEEILNIEGNYSEIIDFGKVKADLDDVSCEILISKYTKFFKENPDDLLLLKKINAVLNFKSCIDNKLYADVAEKLYRLEPNAQSASSMARLSFKRKNCPKAISFYEEAIKTEKDQYEKANYCYELASVYLVQKNYEKARSSALLAISLHPKFGKPYVLIGKLYISSAKTVGESETQQRLVYCLAVDYFQKAKITDPQLDAEVNKDILTYSQHFPSKEDAQFEGVKSGDKYTVGGWINESTIVRFKQ